MATKTDHIIEIDFLGTDIENSPARRNRYGIKCSCGQVDATESLDMATADRKISEHLAMVGLADTSISYY